MLKDGQGQVDSLRIIMHTCDDAGNPTQRRTFSPSVEIIPTGEQHPFHQIVIESITPSDIHYRYPHAPSHPTPPLAIDGGPQILPYGTMIFARRSAK